MSFLSKVTKGVMDPTYFITLYGADGVGKSTFASRAPSPIFMDIEDSTEELNVERGVQPRSWVEVLAAIDELRVAKHSYKTFVLESLDWLEPMLFSYVLAKATKESKSGQVFSALVEIPYGAGYAVMLEQWVLFMEKLNQLRKARKMHIILTGHVATKAHDDVINMADYKRNIIKLHENSAAKIREGSKCVLFADYQTFTKKVGTKTRAFSADEDRFLYTQKKPAYDAKNRYGLPTKIRLDWNEFDALAKKGLEESTEAVRKRIEGLLADAEDEALIVRVRDAVAAKPDDLLALYRYEKKLIEIIDGKEAAIENENEKKENKEVAE